MDGGGKGLVKRAVDIEQLVVWAYLRQRVGVVARLPDRETTWQEGRSTSGDGMSAVERFRELGGWVDDANEPGFAVSRDAWAVDAQVDRLGGVPAWLVRTYGRSGARPVGWDGPAKLPRPQGGAPRVIRFNASRNKVWEHCPVDYFDRSAEREAARSRWFMWWSALSTLASEFRASPQLLTAHEVIGFAAPMRPWEMPEQITGVDLRRTR